MKNTYFKFLSLLLIFSISASFVFVFPRRAEADAISAIVYIVAAVLVASAVVVDYISCRINVIFSSGCYGGESGGAGVSGGTAALTPVLNDLGVCTFQSAMNFYIPQMNQASRITDFWCSEGAVNDSQRNIAIYRFTYPASAGSDAINNWYFNLLSQVGSGYGGQITNYDWYLCSNDSGPYAVMPYSSFCSGNTCRFTDSNIPPDVYVAYAAKVLGDYKGPSGGAFSLEFR